jgi:hypothetical protein
LKTDIFFLLVSAFTLNQEFFIFTFFSARCRPTWALSRVGLGWSCPELVMAQEVLATQENSYLGFRAPSVV